MSAWVSVDITARRNTNYSIKKKCYYSWTKLVIVPLECCRSTEKGIVAKLIVISLIKLPSHFNRSKHPVVVATTISSRRQTQLKDK